MNNLLTDFQSFWKDLDPNQKVSLVFATVVVVAGMVALMLWAQRPQMRLLYGTLAEKDAASIVNHLESQGIDYEIRSGGSSIFVPEKDVYKARMDVVTSGIVSGDAVGFEIFDNNTFGASDFIQRTNFIRAIQGELARTIAQLRGVQSARVMVVMPDNRLLLVNSNIETTASVFVDVGGGSLSVRAVESIQALVANAVEGLSVGNVAVIDNHGNVLSVERDSDSLVAGSSAIMDYRQSIETYYSGKVETMLERVLGPGQAVVRVFAKIDTEQFSKLEEDFDDVGSAVRTSTTEEEIRTSTDPMRSGPVTVSDVAERGGAEGGAGRTAEETRNRKQEFEIDRTVTNTSRAPGSIQRLTASVFVASKPRAVSAEGEVTGVPEYESRSAEEMARLEGIVANALGVDLGDSTTGAVTIQEMAFAGSPLLGGFSEAPEETFDLRRFLQFGEEIAGTLVAVVIFLVFFQMYRKLKAQPSPFDELKRQQMGPGNNRDGLSSAEVTPDLLNELIQQKPDNAAATLRTWMKGKDDA